MVCVVFCLVRGAFCLRFVGSLAFLLCGGLLCWCLCFSLFFVFVLLSGFYFVFPFFCLLVVSVPVSVGVCVGENMFSGGGSWFFGVVAVCVSFCFCFWVCARPFWFVVCLGCWFVFWVRGWAAACLLDWYGGYLGVVDLG